MARDGTKTGGRGKGSLNKKTVAQLDRANRVMQIIEEKYLETDIELLSPHQRMQLYTDVMEYVAPKLARVEQKVDTTVKIIKKATFK